MCFTFTACNKKEAAVYAPDSLVEREQGPSLTQEYAKFRSLQVSDLRYELDLDVSDDSQFSGRVLINFDLNSINRSPITLDFDRGEIQGITINGASAAWHYEQWFIRLAPEQFQSGHNSISVEFSRPYAKDGDGLHQYRDASSGKTYLYSNFEPYNANKLFPHFDQPDLKASYTLNVKAPKDWQLISATREFSVIELEALNLWQFPESPKMSSYVFSMHAGPYHVWHDSIDDIELRLFSRQEIKNYVKISDWFEATKQSLAFFERYFDYPYPFKKYDQIIVPDFNAGAMENIAAVTFSELYVSRSEKTERMRRRLASAIAHELAHQWFGNLVTMEWWNGLWLNESFATYMAFLQMEDSGEYPLVWDDFFHRMKRWAYTEDQLVTTHAIEQPVATSADAFTSFDGITYGKGAAVLRQLSFKVGEENFRTGIASYFQEHAYGNANLDDFFHSLERSSGKDLKNWKEEWLLSAGLNTVSAMYSCDEDQLKSLDLIQSAPTSWPSLRTQNIKVALFDTKNNTESEIVAYQVFDVVYAGEKTKIDLSNNEFPCPDFVFTNYGDFAYVKTRFDQVSLSALQDSINKFSDISVRTGAWLALWDAVVDAELSIAAYLDLVTNNIATEEHLPLVRMVGLNTKSALNYLAMMQLGDRFLDKRSELNDLFWAQFVDAEPKSDRKRLYLGLVIDSAFSHNHLKRLRQLLNLSAEQIGLRLDHDLRWLIIARLNRYQFEDYQELLSAEQKLDSSDRAQKSALVSEAERPDSRVKQMWLVTLIDNDIDIKLSHKRAVMNRLYQAEQRSLLKPYAASILANLPRISEREDDQFLKIFTKNLAPSFCEIESVRALEDALHTYKKLKPVVIKELKIALQKDQRCLAMKNKLTSIKH